MPLFNEKGNYNSCGDCGSLSCQYCYEHSNWVPMKKKELEEKKQVE